MFSEQIEQEYRLYINLQQTKKQNSATTEKKNRHNHMKSYLIDQVILLQQSCQKKTSRQIDTSS